jgi:hypothetical protein
MCNFVDVVLGGKGGGVMVLWLVGDKGEGSTRNCCEKDFGNVWK